MSGAPYNKSDYDALVTFGSEKITVATSAIGFTAATFDPVGGAGPAKAAFVTVDTAAIRHLCSGTPDSTTGEPAEPGEHFVVWGTVDVRAFRAIRRDSTSAVINVQYAR